MHAILRLLRLWGPVAVLLSSLSTAWAQGGDPQHQLNLTLVPYTSRVTNPVHITHAEDGSHRLFIVEQGGRIRIIKDQALVGNSFLDITNRVSCCGERGLLGLAFPPQYANKGHFYVNSTDASGNTVVARYHVTTNPDVADPNSEEIILSIAQPFANHNGGHLAFGPDGYLYIGMGDGGSRGDPLNNGQSLNTLLGKILRIDVESGTQPYAIPPTNPFVSMPAYRSEIWAFGLRNPWKFSFDRQTGDLYIGDVGQNTYEEINVQSVSSSGGENYGWKVMEGVHCYNASSCDQSGLTFPVVEYDHSQGCSVTGGVVYRGQQFPRLDSMYLYGDFCSGRIWGLIVLNGYQGSSQLLDSPLTISTFGEDEAGEVYVADYGSGTIYRVTDAAPPKEGPPTNPDGPDLTGTWQSATQSCKGSSATLKCKLRGTFLTENRGLQKAPVVSLRFYLSQDTDFDANDTLLKEMNVSSLKSNKAKAKKLKVSLPTSSSASGQTVIAVIDSANMVVESDEANNTIISLPLP